MMTCSLLDEFMKSHVAPLLSCLSLIYQTADVLRVFHNYLDNITDVTFVDHEFFESYDPIAVFRFLCTTTHINPESSSLNKKSELNRKKNVKDVSARK